MIEELISDTKKGLRSLVEQWVQSPKTVGCSEELSSYISLGESFFGREVVVKYIYENIVAVYDRFLAKAEVFDAQPDSVKEELFFAVYMQFCASLHQYSEQKGCFSKNIHDKKERKKARVIKEGLIEKRRQVLQDLQKDAVESLFQIAFPEGVSSLILPIRGSFFSSFVEPLFTKTKKSCETLLHRYMNRKYKDVLFLYGMDAFATWCHDGCPCREESICSNGVESFVEQIEKNVPLLLEWFVVPVWKPAAYFSKQKVAVLIASFLRKLSQNISIRDLLVQGIYAIFFSRGITQKSPFAYCSDEKIPLGLIFRFYKKQEASALHLPKNFLEFMTAILTATSKEDVAKTVLSSFPWKELFMHLVAQMQEFVFSTSFDEGCLKLIKNAQEPV